MRVDPNTTRLNADKKSMTHDRPVYYAGQIERIICGWRRVGLSFAGPTSDSSIASFRKHLFFTFKIWEHPKKGDMK